MMVNTRFSREEELESTFFQAPSSFYCSELPTSSNYLIMNRSSRSNTVYSSPLTESEERKSSDSVPISPYQNIMKEGREHMEIAQMEVELQFKTLEMLALIKGTTPLLAFEAEREEELRSQRDRSTDKENEVDPEDDYNIYSTHYDGGDKNEREDNHEYLIGDSYADEDGHHLTSRRYSLSKTDEDRDDDEEVDIFGMEI